MLYHGTDRAGLRFVKANSKSHTSQKMVAFFTEDRCYALVCCRKRQQNFVTMGLGKDGKQHYFERFPHQLQVLYGGKQGYLYCPASEQKLTNTIGHTWESECDVPVYQREAVSDVYREILQEEARGNITIHRYHEIDPLEQKMHANYIRDHLQDEGEEMARFYYAHFSTLWDEKD